MADSNNNNTTENNEDELQAPSWLNKDFFEMVLKQYDNNENLEVESVNIIAGTGQSDHFASVIYRAKIFYAIQAASGSKFISLIVKTTPEQEGLKMEMLQEFSFFKTEILMYADILPKVNNLLKSTVNHENKYSHTPLYGRMIYSSTNPHECIVFEDLVERGYEVVSKRDCTMNEVNLALDKLARLHAASYKLLHEGNTTIPTLNSTLTKEVIEKYNFLPKGLTYLKELLNSQDDLHMYLQYIENMEKTLFDDVVDYFNPEKIRERGGILVMTHGDFHARNIMVQYRDDALRDVILIDFQICFHGSAVLDLMYASVLLLSREMRMCMKQREEIFSNYIEIFQTTLKQLKFTGNIPTKGDFEDEWKRYKRWEIVVLMNYLIFAYAISEGEISVSDLFEKPELRRKIWQNEKFIEEIRTHIPRMRQSGIFD